MTFKKRGLIFLVSFMLTIFLNTFCLWGWQVPWYGLPASSVAYAQIPFSPVTFVGTDNLQIERLAGSPALGTSRTEAVFLRGTWQFLEGGRFIFAPSPRADVRQDVFPINGTYSVSDDQITLQGESQSEEGSDTFSIDGTVQLQGNTAQVNIIYAATARGAESVVQISQVLTEASQAQEEEVAIIGNVSVPSEFAVSFTGSVDNQSFSALSGSLKILPSPYDNDSNPFFVSLSTDVQNEFGSFYWASKGEPSPGVSTSHEFYSRLTVENGQIEVNLTPSEEVVRSDVFWFTEDSGTLGQIVQAPIGVNQVRRGELSFTVNGNQVEGTFSTTGTNWFGQESNYRADFSGQLVSQKSADMSSVKLGLTKSAELSLHKGITQVLAQNSERDEESFSGTWETDDFGTIEINQEVQEVEGTYSGRGGGQISGTVEGNRLNFSWQDATGSGWGFFRAIASGRTLAGKWGQENEVSGGENIIANRMGAPTVESSVVNVDNLLEESFRGRELAIEGRCEEAIPILSQSLALYKAERDRTATSDAVRDTNLISELSILTHLISCHFSLSNEDAFLLALTDVLDIRQALTAREYLSADARTGLSQLTDSLDIWRVRLDSDTERITALDQSRSFFDRLTRVWVELDEPEQALLAAEKGRARAIADLISGGLSEASDERTRIADAPTLEEIRHTAQEQQATLVEYAIVPSSESGHKDSLYIWVVEPSGEIRFNSKVMEGASLKQMISDSRQALGVRLRGGFDPVSDEPKPEVQREKLQSLYQLLITPIQTWLPKGETDRIVFIPQDELFLVPFAALLDGDGQPLIVKHTMNTAPSIQVLNLTHQRRMQMGDRDQIKGDEVLLVGNPAIPAEVGDGALNLGDLPYAEAEVGAIADLYGAQPLIRQAASETAVKQLMPTARIVHLATHGLLDSFEAEEGGIPGSIVLSADAENDGLLISGEILQMNLNAELVVLSACDTGLGDITGDGVVGLSRAFVSAGVPGVLVSLWAVPDASTAELMVEFYRQFQSGQDTVQSLRQAMIKTIVTNSDPRDWAAFVLVGEGA
jgi:CHAT domain-containing protein